MGVGRGGFVVGFFVLFYFLSSTSFCALSLPKLVFFDGLPDRGWVVDSESYLLCLFRWGFRFYFAVTKAHFAIFVFCFVMSFRFSSHALFAIVYYVVI